MFRIALLFAVIFIGVNLPAEEVDFIRDVKPILEFNCVSCHRAGKDEGDVRLDVKEFAFEDIEIINPGKAEDSLVYTTTVLPPKDRDIMPPIETEKDYPLTKAEAEVLKHWIDQGAKWPDGVKLQSRRRLPKEVKFVEHVQPLIEFACVKCHWEEKKEGRLRLDTKKYAFKKKDVLIPGKPLDSEFYILCTLEKDDEDFMPPEPEQPLSPEELAVFRRWIEEGADWPEEAVLQPRKRPVELTGIDPKELFKKLGFDKKKKEEKFEKQTINIPGSSASFQIVPIPGGEFTIGSPKSEPERSDDEGPQRKVKISPFWMGKNEVTWDEYELWGLDYDRGLREENVKLGPLDLLADVVTRPTPPYRDMTFGMGRKGFPAICMTQLAAKTYCMWLSAKTGKFFRLPTEAEWEYACRAGTKTAFHFGDDPKDLIKYAWFDDNSEFQYQKVGTKLANPWGLHDMHGNVWEWVLDQYSETPYEAWKDKGLVNPYNLPKKLYPRVVKGGSWDNTRERLRSASRMASHPDWKKQDPQIPKSVWYHTDALWVGFRVVSPKELPKIEDLNKYWPSLEEMKAIPER